jgi:hypothetical protein
VAVLELFALVFFSAASARGQYKSAFSLAVFLTASVNNISTDGLLKKTACGNKICTGGFHKQPPVTITLAVAGCLRKSPVETRFKLAVFLSNRQWK